MLWYVCFLVLQIHVFKARGFHAITKGRTLGPIQIGRLKSRDGEYYETTLSGEWLSIRCFFFVRIDTLLKYL